VCGPNLDPALVRFSADFHWLAAQGIAVGRYNLAQQPQAYAANPTVRAALVQDGNGCLPLVLVNGIIASKGRYPSRRELAGYVGVEYEEPVSLPVIQRGC